MREKGIEILVALTFVREAAGPDVDLVILASRDTDLAPALDKALHVNRAKVESCAWISSAQRAHRILLLNGEQPCWAASSSSP